MESAATLEATLGRETTCFLFDAPHPVQFKSEWNDVPDDGSVRDEDSNDDASDRESTGLTYMEVALTSFHFDTVAAGWSTMSRREKYDAFETVTFQATGRRVDARAMDEEISAGPYAAQWNSGFVLDEKTGASDVSAWRILRGDFDRTAGEGTTVEGTVEGTTVSGDDEETSSSPRTSSPTPSHRKRPRLREHRPQRLPRRLRAGRFDACAVRWWRTKPGRKTRRCSRRSWRWTAAEAR